MAINTTVGPVFEPTITQKTIEIHFKKLFKTCIFFGKNAEKFT